MCQKARLAGQTEQWHIPSDRSPNVLPARAGTLTRGAALLTYAKISFALPDDICLTPNPP